MTLSRSIIIVLLGFSFVLATPAFAQTKAELEQVTSITKREQTNYSALNFIAGLALTKGDYKKAQSCYKKILDIIKSDPGVGPKSAQYALYMSKLAICEVKETRMDQKDRDEARNKLNIEDARKLSKSALALIDGQTPDNNPEEGNYIILTRQNCKMVLGKDTPPPGPPKPPPLELKSIPLLSITSLKGREQEIRSFLKKAEKKGTSSTPYTKDLLYLANILTLEKRTAEAEPMFKKAIPNIERKSGKDSQELITALSNYGYCLVQAGKTNDAGLILNRMQTIRAAQEAKLQSQARVKSNPRPHSASKS